MKLKTSYFVIGDLFDVVSGKTSNLNELSPGTTPFVSATEKNNGVSAYIDDSPTFPGNQLTISRNGSVCEVFYQPNPFCASLDDIRILTPKEFELNKYIGLYLSAIIRKEKFRYSYGRKFGSDRIRQTKIALPVDNHGNPNWQLMEEFIQKRLLPKISVFNEIIGGFYNTSAISNKQFNLWGKKWAKFKYGGESGVFIIKNGYYNKKPSHTEKGIIPFIGSTEFNNGVTDYYSIKDIANNHKDERSKSHDIKQKLFAGNCITVSNNGSVGNAFYQENEFTCSHDINVLYLKERDLNKYIAMFICTLIKLEKYRWNYGRKWRPMRMPDSDILLPILLNGKPDFEFMENYIKSLRFSGAI